MIILLNAYDWVSIWFYISLVWADLGWVNGDGCGWGCGYRVTFVSNVPIRYFLSFREMFLRLEPSMIAFRSVYLISPCSGNTFSQYRIWTPKDDRRAVAWVLSYQFPTIPSCVIVFFSPLYLLLMLWSAICGSP